MGVDIGETGLDIGNPMRIVGGLGLAQQGVTFAIGLEHDIDQALGAIGRFLGEAADGPARRDGDASALQGQLASDGVKQGGFADAVAPNETNPCARHDLHRAVIDQKAAGDTNRNVSEGKHPGFSPEMRSNASVVSRKGEASSCRLPGVGRSRLQSRASTAIVFLTLHLGEQGLEPGRQIGGVGYLGANQLLPDCPTNRSACRVIEAVRVIGRLLRHLEFHSQDFIQ